jgi:hypothetical protein
MSKRVKHVVPVASQWQSDTALRELVYHCFLSSPRTCWKAMLKILVRSADRMTLDAVRSEATAAGVWRDAITPWQRPPVFRHILSFVDWRTQWVGVERVCKGWQEQCGEVGGCSMVELPATITDEHLRLVVRHHRSLTQLNLRGRDNLTDKGLSYLAMFSNLNSLNLSHCFNLTDGAMVHLAGLSNLNNLDLTLSQTDRRRNVAPRWALQSQQSESELLQQADR